MSVVFQEIPTVEELQAVEPAEVAFRRHIQQALDLPASDLYFAWNEDDVSIAARHLGILKHIDNVSRSEGARLINATKAMAGMDTVKKNHPQDGRYVLDIDGGERVDLRISTIPTLFGEDMSIRLLQRNSALLSLDNLGLQERNHFELSGLLGQPGGLILVTGPSGAGKTTTLYACLKHLDDGTRKINTIEDPIEYTLRGVRQSQVNLRTQLDFPELLRSVMRQSPDVIMVGEIRDAVTAETAVRAANSGHLVLATLHAPIAAAAVDSMLTYGVPPHFLATSLLGIVSQRLVRTLCGDCKEPFDISTADHTFESVKKWLEPGQGSAINSPVGCHHCRQEGYTGRTGVFEVLRVTREIRRLIFDRQSTREIHDLAVKQGMVDLRRATLLKLAQGVTSTRELTRLIPTIHVLADY